MHMRSCFLFISSFYGSGLHRSLHSFPTRRSSDLASVNCCAKSSLAPDLDIRSLRRRISDRSSLPASPERTSSVEVVRSEEHTSELQSHSDLVCRLLLEKKKT